MRSIVAIMCVIILLVLVGLWISDEFNIFVKILLTLVGGGVSLSLLAEVIEEKK